MSDHNGLRYLFDQPNLNAMEARWLATLSDFDFKIRYIKGKWNMVTNSLSIIVQVNHITYMSSYRIDLHGLCVIEQQEWCSPKGERICNIP